MKQSVKELRSENKLLRYIVADFHPLARRYCDGRMTYVTSMFNEHTRTLIKLGFKLNPTADNIIFARDGGGRKFDGLSDEESTPGTAEAIGLTNTPE